MTDQRSKMLFLFFAIACTALRVYLKLTAIDPATGFYEGGGAAVPALWVLAAAAVVALALLRLRRTPPAVLQPGPCCRVFAALAGLSGGLFAAVYFLDRLSQMDLSGGLLVGTVGLLLQMITLVIAPAFTLYLLLRVAALGGRQGFETNGWIALAPIIWQLGLLLLTFMSYTAVRSVSDQMFTILSMVLSLLFWLAHARWAGNVLRGKGIARMHAYGFPYAVLAISTGAGMVAAFLAGRPVQVGLGLPGALYLLFSGLYAAALGLCAREAR